MKQGKNYDAFSPHKSGSFRKAKAESRLARSNEKAGGPGLGHTGMNLPILHYVDTISETEEAQSQTQSMMQTYSHNNNHNSIKIH